MAATWHQKMAADLFLIPPLSFKKCATQHKGTRNCDTVMLSVTNKPIRPSVIMLNVIRLSVVAPNLRRLFLFDVGDVVSSFVETSAEFFNLCTLLRQVFSKFRHLTL